ncbi:MAG: MBL fold metallo-hydrolase [Synergistales bacterium]|nr:MBL fold metallo-hydrolase [Synergistales bacterium]
MKINDQRDLPENFIWFLGTSGARFSMIFQVRASGGIWIRIRGLNMLIDPGPGSLVRITDNFPLLDPMLLDAIIVTHRHMDHSSDLNVMTEAMTYGGRIRKGKVLLPRDCVDPPEPVLLGHLRDQLTEVKTWEEGTLHPMDKGVGLKAVRMLHHGVTCFGFILEAEGLPRIGFIPDTSFREELLDPYLECQALVLNTTLLRTIERIDHLSIPEVEKILEKIRPDWAILTHFGTSILEKGPEQCIRDMDLLWTKVIAARDNMIFDLDSRKIVCPGDPDRKGRLELLRTRMEHAKKLKHREMGKR